MADASESENRILLASSESSANRPTSPERTQPLISTSWFHGQTFGNPWATWVGFIWRIIPLLKWKLCNRSPSPPSKSDADEQLPILDPDTDTLNSRPEKNEIRVTWLGHASVLMQFHEGNVLCDPIFSERCGPCQKPCFSYRRFRRAPLTVEQLPVIDAVCISHNHYDHLDLTTVQQLHGRFKNDLRWFVPRGLKEWFLSVGVNDDDVKDLMWWEESSLSTMKGTIKFVFTPTQHWSLRTPFNRNASLWGSWAIVADGVKAWFAGDTGYCTVFKEIGQHFQSFDFAAIPIGSYLPRDVMMFQHCSPEEAVKIHQDVNSKQSLGIHWGTFTMSALEHFMDPTHRLRLACEDSQVDKDRFFVLNHGETKLINCDKPD